MPGVTDQMTGPSPPARYVKWELSWAGTNEVQASFWKKIFCVTTAPKSCVTGYTTTREDIFQSSLYDGAQHEIEVRRSEGRL